MKLSIQYIVVFLCLVTSIQAQTFSADSVKFLKEITAHFSQVNKEDAKQFQNEFEGLWLGNQFTPPIRKKIYATTNEMATKRMKPYPEFKDYMLSVMYAIQSGLVGEQFEEWHTTVEQSLKEKNKKRFPVYVKTCSHLFKDNLIYKSSSTQWKASNTNYQFSYEKEPKITFEEFDLTCLAKNDSSVVYKTKGVYYPYNAKWKGVGGKLTWIRAELPKDKYYAQINTYEIRMKNARFNVDSVLFYNEYFEKPVLGQLTENVISNRGADQVSFPKFVSYDERLVIKDIFPGVDYDGGFTVEGGDLRGSGSFDNLAKMVFYYKDKPFFQSESISFVIDKNGASSQSAKSAFYIEDDSIVHPGLNFQYKHADGEEQVILTRGEGLSSAPFINSYHELEMYTEALFWKKGDPLIRFEPLFGNTNTSAQFISTDRFDQNAYDRLSGMGANILIQIRAYANQAGTRELSLVDIATALRMDKQDAEGVLYQLAVQGFVNYKKEIDIVLIQDKLYDYIASRAGKKDYDVIEITSEAKNNAELSLVSKDLIIRGVEKFTLSDAQFVRAYPENKELIVKKNRDMNFAGIINVGRTEYFGSQFTFDYEDFSLNLITCDSMRLRATNQGNSGPPQIRLISKIEGISGTIQIDEKNNKSGIDTSLSQYPILKTTEKSYVYYDDPSIHKGAYKRDNFKFIIAPFEMDSLDNFANSNTKFEGEFISAGIFPNMDLALTIQDDYSLGFMRETPDGGTGIYGDKANYQNEIRLSGQGLQGSGDIDFLTSHATSTAITFFPDSLNAVAETYKNEAKIKSPDVPLVEGEMVFVSYVPGDKVLRVESRDKELNFYGEEKAILEGALELRAEGMTGAGKMYIANGEVNSGSYKFLNRTIDADTAEFRLRTLDYDAMVFRTENVNTHIDFASRNGLFESNEGESFVEFPEMQYICYMDKFNWFIDNDDVEMESKKTGNINIDSDLDIEQSNFYSIHPEQDSLNFRAPRAKLETKKKTLFCWDVDYIQVADARIFPDSGKVQVKSKAQMQTLENAKILANYITKYHNIFDAKVDIKAAKDYSASGYYNYVDEFKQQQKIFLANVRLDTTYQTIAEGSLDREAGFKLSPQFDYSGDIQMFASFKELTFTGETRLSAHDCEGIERNWMKFSAAIDPENIYIPVSEELYDTEGNPVGTGLILNTKENTIYSTFLSNKESATHIDVMTANGFLRYDKTAKEYRIGSKEKLQEINLPGNYVSLNTQNCKMLGDGQFNFGVELGMVELTPVGTIDYNPMDKKMDIKASLKMVFPFNDEAFDPMVKHFEEYPDLTPVDFNNSTYEKSLREIVGLEASDKIISDLNIYGKIKGKQPDELASQIYLSDVNFVWDEDESAYISEGKIGIATLHKEQLFKQVDGKIAIYKRTTGDEISIILNLDEKNYYFFNYKRGLLQTFSTNEKYNTVILETKNDKTKFKAPKGKEDLQFMLGTKTKAIAFMRTFEE